MPESTDEDLVRRCWEFELGIGEATAVRVEDVGAGITAVLDTRIPLVWDSNYVVVETADVSPNTVADKADEVLGGLGMKHRQAYTRDPAQGALITAGLVKLGWEADLGVYQVLRREPNRPAEVDAEELDFDQLGPVTHMSAMDEDWGTEEVVEQLRERDRLIGEAYRDRWFAARHEGEIASCCRLTQRDGIGQVENVSTLESARGHGLARAVVLAAAQASVDDGDELTFIGALRDDWPRQLYERLGFDLVGETSYAQRKP
jgi:GNAT superfamily N-acetyltransferase